MPRLFWKFDGCGASQNRQRRAVKLEGGIPDLFRQWFACFLEYALVPHVVVSENNPILIQEFVYVEKTEIGEDHRYAHIGKLPSEGKVGAELEMRSGR